MRIYLFNCIEFKRGWVNTSANRLHTWLISLAKITSYGMRRPAYQQNTPFSETEQDEIFDKLPEPNTWSDEFVTFNYQLRERNYEIKFWRIPIIDLDNNGSEKKFDWFYFEWKALDENGTPLPPDFKLMKTFSSGDPEALALRRKRRRILRAENARVRLSRDVSTTECKWLERALFQGEVLFVFRGFSPGVSSRGIACMFAEGEPYFEVPTDAVELYEE